MIGKKWLRALTLGVIACLSGGMARAGMVSLVPTEDTFGRANAPTSSFGSSGAVHVSGSAATNGQGVVQGIADSWLKFDTSAAVAQFDALYGVDAWTITSATLALREVASPNNGLFTRGSGQFDVTWVGNDDWSEGTGSPAGPGTATGNQIGYTYGLSLLDPGEDEALGTFMSLGTNTVQEFALAPTEGFLADAETGGALTIYLSAADPEIGFTIWSRGASVPPRLTLVAVPEPNVAVDVDGWWLVDRSPAGCCALRRPAASAMTQYGASSNTASHDG